MYKSNNINLENLNQIIQELLNEGQKEITIKELEEIYENEQIKENQTNSTEKYVDIKKRVREKIDIISQISISNGLSRKIYSDFKEQYIKIVTCKKTNRQGKIIELKEIEVIVDKIKNDLEKIEKTINDIKEKIKNINNLYQSSKSNLSIYQSNDLPSLRDELNQVLSPSQENSDTSLILTNITKISQKLDNIEFTLHNLSKLSMYRKDSLNTYDVAEYEINGIIIKINISEKTYEITSNKKLIETLKECKINKLLKLLEKRLQNVPFEEIIEPKYVTEKKLSEYLTKNQVPTKEVLKYDLNNLLKHLNLDSKMNKIPTSKELSENSETVKLFFEIISILNEQGFETHIGKEKGLFEEIIKMYQSIKLENIENIYNLISSIIYNQYQNQTFVYSSLQNVYNCIDIEYRKQIHQELTNNKTKKESKILKQTIDFLKKYSRNKDNKPYPEDEIFNFLRQKSIIVNSEYEEDTESINEYMTSIKNEDINSVINKLTRKHY